MIFHYQKIKELRKLKKISAEKIGEKIGVSRITLWRWETGAKTPTESETRLLADALDVSVAEISDLSPSRPLSSAKYSDKAETWISFLSTESNLDRQKKLKRAFLEINKLNSDLDKAAVVIKALLRSTNSLLYIKDKNLKYITANDAFLRNVSLSLNYKVLGKNDNDFFPIPEAKINHQQDYEVLSTGNPIINHEQFIPGSRKKKWSLVSKLPIWDIDNKVAGVLANFTDITEKKKSEEKIKSLLNIMDNVDECIWMGKFNKAKKFEFTYINNAFTKVSGLTKEALFDNPYIWRECVHPDDIDWILKKREKQSSELFLQDSYEYKIINKKTGLERIIHEVVYVENSTLFGISRDITEQMQVYKQNTHLKNLIDSSKEIVWYGKMNKDNIVDEVDYVNKSIFETTGITVEDTLTTKSNAELWHSLVHKDDLDLYMEWRKPENNNKEIEYRIINKITDETLWVNAKNYIIDDIKYGQIRNITDRKKKELQLKTLEFAVNNMNDGFWIVKDNGINGIKDKIQYLNNSYLKIFGLTKEDLLNNIDAWFDVIHHDDKESVMSKFESNDYPKYYEYRIIRPTDKKLIWIHETVYLENDYNYGIIKDMTNHYDQKEYNIRLEIAKKLKTKNIDILTIAETTELPASSIEKL